MKRAALVVAGLALLLVALVAMPLLRAPTSETAAESRNADLPWQVEILPGGGSRVFALELGKSRLGEARDRLGPDLQLAVIVAPDAPPALEAYYDRVLFGFITGKLVLTAALPPDELAAMARRASKTSPLPSGARRAALVAADAAAALAAPISALSFVPSVDLDESVVIQRFGPPAERVRSSDDAVHLLYPAIGLDIVLDDKRKELLQYVAPKDFARLREPLVKAGS